MRPELALWLVAALLVLAGGGFCLSDDSVRATGQGGWPAWARRLRQRAPAVCACLGLAAIAGGLIWQGSVNRAWPGGTAAGALILMAGAALLLGAWAMRKSAAPGTPASPAADAATLEAASGMEHSEGDSRRLVYGGGLLATGVLILGATALTWTMTPPAAPQSHSWLFGLRSGLAGLGLGSWPFVAAGNLAALWRARAGATAARSSSALGQAILRAGYPWLTAALLAGGAWQMAAYAVPWRGVPADLWLEVAWLLGGAYLVLGSVRRADSLSAWPLTALSLAGLAAALLAAGQAGSLIG